MSRLPIIVLALAFTAALGGFTASDLIHNGPTLPGVLGAFVVILFAVALIGALLHPPEQ
jgi:hypothetical protein